MLEVLLAVSLVANVLMMAAFLVFLHIRDERQGKERQLLLNRIQSPATAVAQTIEPNPSPEKLYVPFDDDGEFFAATADNPTRKWTENT